MTGPGGLVASLERPLPKALPPGVASAVFCIGTCFHPRARLTGAAMVVDGRRQPCTAFAMARPDVASRGTPGHRSGFWATVDVGPRPQGARIEIAIEATLPGGARATASLGRIDVVAPDPPQVPEPRPERMDAGLIAICMATFEPDEALFRAQVDSLREQSDRGWVCLISDDCSGAPHFELIEQVVAGDPRFAVSRAPARQGFYRNFERALTMIPQAAELVALCDQDDRWHPDKLATLRGSIGDAVLVYSDQRLVDAEGRVLRDTLWRGRRNNHTDLVSMVVANTVTGAATLFRRALTEVLLPFPDPPGFQFHDHWLGVAALAMGELAYVDRPLYDYTQHAGAVFGDVSTGASRRPTRGRWRAGYFYGYLARAVQARTVLARRGAALPPARRRALERFLAADRSPAATAWLGLRGARRLWGRNETLGSETQMALGILWRRLGPRDATFPPPSSFEQPRLRRWRANV